LSVRSIVGLGLLLSVGLLLVPAFASAAPEHAFLETFGSAAQPSFTNPGGMAVDPATGDLYVTMTKEQG
jgi:DNA-binding beta-propeller fold protein YncE